jgi:hypothetical protein
VLLSLIRNFMRSASSESSLSTSPYMADQKTSERID